MVTHHYFGFFIKIFFQIISFFIFLNISYCEFTFNPNILIQEDSVLNVVKDKKMKDDFNKFFLSSSLRRGCFITNGTIGKFYNVFLNYYSRFNFSQTDGTNTNLSEGYLKFSVNNFIFKFGQFNSIIGIEPNTRLSNFIFLETSTLSDSFLTKETFGFFIKYFFKDNIFLNIKDLLNISFVFSLENMNNRSIKKELKDKYYFMFRSVILPINHIDCTFHFGLSFQYANNHTTPLSVNTGIECRDRAYNINRIHTFVGTGNAKKSVYSFIYGIETILKYKCFSIQSEFFYNFICWEHPIDPSTYDGFYFQVGYFLTGEKRSYIMESGSMINPRRFLKNYGAIELAIRYCFVDTHKPDDDLVVFPETGITSSLTFGVNWFVNSKIKIQLNYINTDFIYNDWECNKCCKYNTLGSRLQISI